MTEATVRKLVARSGKDARIGLSVHPHMLRHATGFYLANNGVDTRTIQAYLGHRNIMRPGTDTSPRLRDRPESTLSSPCRCGIADIAPRVEALRSDGEPYAAGLGPSDKWHGQLLSCQGALNRGSHENPLQVVPDGASYERDA